jgi:hypothetical protein
LVLFYYPEISFWYLFLLFLLSVTTTQKYKNLPSEIRFWCKEVLVQEGNEVNRAVCLTAASLPSHYT